MGNSNKNGRALEYVIVEKIYEENKVNCICTNRTKNDNNRDYSKFINLTDDLKSDFVFASEKIYTWLQNKYNLKNNTFEIDRLPDTDGKKNSNPTDISIKLNNQLINLSIKHNHKATKHQRPASAAQHLGIKKGNELDLDHRLRIKLKCNQFFKTIKKINANFEKFKEIKEYDSRLITHHLYRPICDEVVRLYSQSKDDPKCVNNLFRFLVGDRNFFKLRVKNKKTYLIDFSNIEDPSSFIIKTIDDSHIEIKFNNNWIFNMRLHTASSRIEGCEKNCCSLKFDTHLSNDPITEVEI